MRVTSPPTVETESPTIHPLVDEQSNATPTVSYENLAELNGDPVGSVMTRAANLPAGYRAVYLSPVSTVLCRSPSPAFWRRAYKELGRARRRVKRILDKCELRSRDAWSAGSEYGRGANYRREHRKCSLTGYLCVDAKIIPLDRWPTRKEVGYKPTRRGGRHRRRRGE